MGEYTFEVSETLSRTVTVKAKDLEEAQSIVEEQYSNEKIVLDSSDFVEYNIEPVYKEH